MGAVRDEKPEEEFMTDVKLVNIGVEESDDDEDEDEDVNGNATSSETFNDGQSDSENQGPENVDGDVLDVVSGSPSVKKLGFDDRILVATFETRLDESVGTHVELIPGNVKRRRLHGRGNPDLPQSMSWNSFFGMQGAGWDDESDDDDWSPTVTLPLLWFCRNCTMPNVEKVSHCARCHENRKSGILAEGHLAASTESYEPAGATGVGANSTAPSKDSLSRVFPLDPGTDGTKTAIGFDDRMLLHDESTMKSQPHPERPDRLRAIIAGLAAEGLFPGRCILRPAREATRSELEQVHSQGHVDSVEETCNEDISYFTSDTYANKDSSLAARLAAGISADLATAIVKGEAQNGIALVRPPGHHAEEVNVMGFCLHNNAAVAAKAAQAAGAKKIFILDWDVHHGNGIQNIFEDDPSVLYVSLHRHDRGAFYPGTGGASEVGSGKGEGSSVNIPWICGGIGDNDYIFAFNHIVLPIAKEFRPDFTIVSAGFDAARGDPLGGCEVTPWGYSSMTSMLRSLSGGKMLVVLEGGYNLRSISASVTAVVKVLLGEIQESSIGDIQPTEAGAISMLSVLAVQSRYWPSLRTPEALRNVARLAASNSPKKELLGNLDEELASTPSSQLGPVGLPL